MTRRSLRSKAIKPPVSKVIPAVMPQTYGDASRRPTSHRPIASLRLKVGHPSREAPEPTTRPSPQHRRATLRQHAARSPKCSPPSQRGRAGGFVRPVRPRASPSPSLMPYHIPYPLGCRAVPGSRGPRRRVVVHVLVREYANVWIFAHQGPPATYRRRRMPCAAVLLEPPRRCGTSTQRPSPMSGELSSR